MSLLWLIVIGLNGEGAEPRLDEGGPVGRSETFRTSGGKAATVTKSRARYRDPTLISFTSTFLPRLSVSTRVSRSRANAPGETFGRGLEKRGASDLVIVGVSTIGASFGRAK